MTNPLGTSGDRLQLLATFVKIVEAGSLSAAALQLGTTQPTVSRRLQVLERSFGVPLLQRSTHAMKLTEVGARCFEHAKNLLEAWQAIDADLRGDEAQPRGLLRVMVPHAFGQEQLIAPLAQFLKKHEGVSVDWLLSDREPDFIAEGIDCAIRVGEVDDPGVVAMRLAEVPRIVVAAPRLWGRGAAPKTVEALQPLPWLALRTYYRNEVALVHGTSGRTHAFAIEPRMATDSLYALRNAALARVGAAVVSAWAVADDVKQGRLVHLTPEWQATPLPVFLAYPQARFYPARLRAFADAIRTELPRLTGLRPPTRASYQPS